MIQGCLEDEVKEKESKYDDFSDTLMQFFCYFLMTKHIRKMKQNNTETRIWFCVKKCNSKNTVKYTQI